MINYSFLPLPAPLLYPSLPSSGFLPGFRRKMSRGRSEEDFWCCVPRKEGEVICYDGFPRRGAVHNALDYLPLALLIIVALQRCKGCIEWRDNFLLLLLLPLQSATCAHVRIASTCTRRLFVCTLVVLCTRVINRSTDVLEENTHTNKHILMHTFVRSNMQTCVQTHTRSLSHTHIQRKEEEDNEN